MNICTYSIIYNSSSLKGGMPPKNFSSTMPWDSLSKRLSQISLMPCDAGGNGECGGCFFKSVSHQLYKTPELHFQICMAGTSHLNDHPELFNN